MESNRKSTCLLLGVGFLYLCMAIWLWSFTAEDAYIVYRYAENFATGRGLVFNQGEAVCALTSPLHALLCTSMYAVTKATVLANKVAGLTAVLAAFLFATRAELRDPRDRLWASILVLLSPFFVLWTIGGLETPFLAALAMLCLTLSRQCLTFPSRINATSLSISLGLLVLTRFDAVLFAVPVYVSVLAERFRRPRSDESAENDTRRFWFSEFLCLTFPGLLLVASWLLSAWWYYNDLLPTSFYHKGPSVSVPTIVNNLIYIMQFVCLSGLPCLLLLAFVGRSGGPRRETSSGDEADATQPPFGIGQTWGCWLGIALMTAYASLTATTHMMFAYRMLVPYLPVLVILLLRVCPTRPANGATSRFAISCGVVVVVAQLLLLVVIDRWSLNPGVIGEYRKLSRREYVQFMQTLDKQASAIQAHWRHRARRKTDQPRIYTYAVGLVSYRLRDAHLLDNGLVSFRHEFHGKPSGIRASADYVMTLTPRHHKLGDQLGNTVAVGGFEKVIEIEQTFDGNQEAFGVYFNRAPTNKRLSKRVK